MSDAVTTSAPGARSFRHTMRRDAGSKVSLEVEVDAERLARQADRVFERHNQKAKIPGFRPGKAPRAMYERSYGAEHLWAEAAEELVDQTYREIVEVEDLEPLDDPRVELTQLEPGKPVRWSATVTVRPEVTLGDYAAHGASIEPTPPSAEEIRRHGRRKAASAVRAQRARRGRSRDVDRRPGRGVRRAEVGRQQDRRARVLGRHGLGRAARQEGDVLHPRQPSLGEGPARPRR